MTSKIKSLLVQVIGIGLAVGLLYLALKNVDFGSGPEIGFDLDGVCTVRPVRQV